MAAHVSHRKVLFSTQQHTLCNMQRTKKTGMGRRTGKDSKSYTLPSSPSHSFSSSSSSDFEFSISISPRKSSAALCPADELFYKGQLLPLHLSPRISMVRTLLLSSSSTSSSSTDTTATNGGARDSTGSSADSQSSFISDLAIFPDCDSSRPSSVTEDDEFKRLHNPSSSVNQQSHVKRSKYFSLSRFSSVFRKDSGKSRDPDSVSGSSVKRMSATAREVIRKYLKKVKPLYEKLSQKQQQQQQRTALSSVLAKTERSEKETEVGGKTGGVGVLAHSFSGNLRYPRRKRCVSSCPSSMRSSPSHSGVLSRSGWPGSGAGRAAGGGGAMYCGDASSMEELQNAIQGAIAHCKNSLIDQNKAMVSNEI
ncbi:probable membrane-associated kinase regulator 1 [Prosopis cineraria]|uniref:probable membrane-associated kinase regulator 1 n=1 Tax=Prosopis cineraria TaxID=364024 RepID=UPI00240FD283|nr:probable membrane-associated kinase regulator 1 [Prosopis cineraria]